MALYFAESTKYADRFAHTTPEGDKELMVVLVLTGEVRGAEIFSGWR